MKHLLQLMAQALGLLGQHLVLVYPILFLMLLLSVLMQPLGLPALEARWLLMGLLLFLLYAAFQAGWLHMVYRMVIQAELRRRRSVASIDVPDLDDLPSLLLPGGFRLFSDFFPGVAQFFVPMLLGALLHGLMILAVLLAIHLSVEQWVGYPPVLLQWVQMLQQVDAQVLESQEHLNRLMSGFLSSLKALPDPQLDQLASFLSMVMAGLVFYGLLSWLTMFWPVFVMVRRLGVLAAYGRSVQQCLKDPLGVIGLGVAYLLTMVLLRQLTAVASFNFILVMILQMMGLLLGIYWVVVQFLYVVRKTGAPELEEPPAVLNAHTTSVDPKIDA
ncbi:MAG: hypothetical protein SFZ03_06555 [Candidatus Melainabacteria bacterium]|nr:hypothetical protein [Candidatus Melainabacteria bacterium]